ncbi:MAG: ribonuclease D, partial [Acidobacteriota bacterium]
MSYELLQDDRALEDRASVWRESECLGIDTEFIRTRTFFPRLGLIQIADAEGCVLLDAVAIENWQPFVDVLESPEIGKILHSPSEDFEV